jgi:hypothetical protein
LRLLIVFAIQPPRGGNGIAAVVGRVRETARGRLRRQLALAFDEDPAGDTVEQLSRLGLAAFDGAFVASQADPGVTLEEVLAGLPDALIGAQRALRRAARGG